jgi:hypothetical protein
MSSSLSEIFGDDAMFGADTSAAGTLAPAGATPASNNDTTPATPTAGAASVPAFRFEVRLRCDMATSYNKSSCARATNRPAYDKLSFAAAISRAFHASVAQAPQPFKPGACRMG